MKIFQLFTKDECDSIINFIESNYILNKTSKLYDSGISSYSKIEIKQSEWFYEKIKNYVNSELSIDALGTLLFVKYVEGDYFPIHKDRVSNSEYHKDFIWNVNVILNDNYDGGEFILNNETYKHPAGSLYYYKSDTLHGVNKITNGNRYIFLYHIRERDIKRTKSAI